jgi:hypothetical protein
MNDKERILIAILERLCLTQFLALRGDEEAKFRDNVDGHEYVHFGAYDDRPIQKGDLVIAQTGPIDDFKIAWVHQVLESDTCLLREIGSNRLCTWSNERFTRIAGMPDMLMLEGEQYIFQQKVFKAFRKGDEYWYRFGGVDFLDGNIARIWIREAFGGLGKPSKPFSCEMTWNKRTSVKKILETMRESGYGTKKFEPVEQAEVEEAR